MTLEQIKNRQEYTNNQLSELLQNIEGVVLSIIGEQPVSEICEKGVERAAPSGLIQEIDREQDVTQRYIEKINNYSRLLSAHTYSPVEAVCQAR